MPTPRKTRVQQQIERATGVTRANTGANTPGTLMNRVRARGTVARTATYRQTGVGRLGNPSRFSVTRNSRGRISNFGQPSGGSTSNSPIGSTRTFAGTRSNG